MSLVPGRVVSQVLLEQLVHVGQLTIPQLVGLKRRGRERGKGEREGRKEGGREGRREGGKERGR